MPPTGTRFGILHGQFDAVAVGDGHLQALRYRWGAAQIWAQRLRAVRWKNELSLIRCPRGADEQVQQSSRAATPRGLQVPGETVNLDVNRRDDEPGNERNRGPGDRPISTETSGLT